MLVILLDKIKAAFRSQGMPKYQNLYLGKGDGKLRVIYGGDIGIVKNCYYEPKLGSYMYWLDFNGAMVTVPEMNLEPVTQN